MDWVLLLDRKVDPAPQAPARGPNHNMVQGPASAHRVSFIASASLCSGFASDLSLFSNTSDALKTNFKFLQLWSTGGDLVGGRSNLGQLGPQGVGMGPAGQANGPGSSPGSGPLAGQAGPMGAFRGVMPPFMYRGGFPGPFPPNFQGPRARFPYQQDGR